MTILNKYLSWKTYLIILGIVILACILVIVLLSLTINKTINAILYIDENKNLKLFFQNSNIDLLNEKKDLVLKIENKDFLIENLSLQSIGNGEYNIQFDNDKIYEFIKENSFYNTQICIGYKRIFDVIF